MRPIWCLFSALCGAMVGAVVCFIFVVSPTTIKYAPQPYPTDTVIIKKWIDERTVQIEYGIPVIGFVFDTVIFDNPATPEQMKNEFAPGKKVRLKYVVIPGDIPVRNESNQLMARLK